MNKFNLTFWGEIQQGKDSKRVKSRFAKLFDIKDPDRLEHFFSGETIILRRNVDRKVAGEYFSKLRKLGVEAKLVKVESDCATKDNATAPQGNEHRAAREQAEQAAAEAEALKKAQHAEKQRVAAQTAAAREAQQNEEKAARKAKLAQEQQHQKEQDAQRQAMEEQSIQRATDALTAEKILKPAKSSVKSRLELPRRNTARAAPALPNQAGAPNFYQLQPFRNTSSIKERAALAKDKKRHSFSIATIALALLLILRGYSLSRPPVTAVTGALGAVVGDGSQLLLLTQEQLLRHDRSGVGRDTAALSALGVSTLRPPALLNDKGELLALGRLLDEGDTKPVSDEDRADTSDPLLRCNLEALTCEAFSDTLGNRQIVAMDLHPLTDELFLLDQYSNELLKLNARGKIQASAKLQLAEHPIVKLDSGLLLTNSASGPAISVYRYEDNAFGQQLDEILLLPPPAVEKEQTLVWDFVRGAGLWWVVLYNPDTQSAGLYRFDSQWNYLSEVSLQSQSWPKQLLPWTEKLLVIDPTQIAIQRFNSSGVAEAPLVSSLLSKLREGQQSRHHWQRLVWTIGLLVCLGVAILGFGRGYLNQLRSLVYRSRPARGAEPIDGLVTRIRWIEAAPNKASRQKLAMISCSITALSILLICVGLGASASVLSAALIALCGPLLGLVILTRSNSAYVGSVDKQLILVDHTHMYQMASGPRLQYRGPFLLIDDVVVFSGSTLIPVLDPAQVQREISYQTRAGVRVDYKTVIVKLLQARHPLAQASKVVAICTGLALSILALGLA